MGGGAVGEIQRRSAVLMESVSRGGKGVSGCDTLFCFRSNRLDDLCQLCGAWRGKIVDL